MAATTILVDLDGTIWDSRPWYAAEISRRSSVSAGTIQYELANGANLVHIAEEHEVSKTDLVNAARQNAGNLNLYDGVEQTLKTLVARKTRLGIVSNLPGWLVRPLLIAKDIDQHFNAVATPKWGVPRKPNPHGIERVLQELDSEPGARTWYVGDGCEDSKAAGAAGVEFAWASYGYHTSSAIHSSYVLESFEDVLLL